MMELTQIRQDYLNIPDAAAETRLSESFWRRVVFQRRLPIVKVGRRVLIRRCDLDTFMNARLIPSGVDSPDQP